VYTLQAITDATTMHGAVVRPNNIIDKCTPVDVGLEQETATCMWIRTHSAKILPSFYGPARSSAAESRLPPGQELAVSRGKQVIKKNVKYATLRKFAESLLAVVIHLHCGLLDGDRLRNDVFAHTEALAGTHNLDQTKKQRLTFGTHGTRCRIIHFAKSI